MPNVKITFDAADDYERYMGAWSRAAGTQFLAWLDPPKQARWLDVGCGTGAFDELILRHCAPGALSGIDPSPTQIDYVRKFLPRHTFEVADSAHIPFADDAFDVVASALVIHFIPDRAAAFAEMKRVARPGGLVAGYTWKRDPAATFAPYAPIMRGTVRIGAEPLVTPVIPETSADGLRATLTAAGFTDIAITDIEVTRTFADFDDYWDTQALPFSPSGKTIASLDAAQREKLRDVMRELLPARADGIITHSSTALACKASKP